MDSLKLTIPTIHLNGSSKESLVKDLKNAHTAIRNAIDALRETAPHGRDYYLQGDKAFEKARNEHCERVVKLEAVKKEIIHIYMKVADL